MFNDGFYPSTEPLIDLMLDPYVKRFNFKGGDPDFMRDYRSLPFKRILEPSAGKGDICTRLVNTYNVKPAQIHCCEIEEDLAAILREKGYTVVDSDFLALSDPYRYDLIIMNPPFRNGADHLLHAWELLHSGHLVCVLNAETLRNPNSEKRRLLLRIIAEHGRYEEVGQPFKDAERPTDVECVVVWLKKEAANDFDFGGAHDVDADIHIGEFTADHLASANLVQALVDQYEAARALLLERAVLHKKFRFYTKDIRSDVDDGSANDDKLNEELASLKRAFWKYIFDRTKLGVATTSNYRQEFMAYADARSNLSFSVRNITEMLEKFYFNRRGIIEACTLEVFDLATSFHDDNKVHIEGWKTNKAYRVNKKVIIPDLVKVERYPSGSESWSLAFHGNVKRSFLSDVDIVLCFLAGRAPDTILKAEQVIQSRLDEIQYGRADYTQIIESEFFRIRFFKKGTVHFEFKDLELLARLNQVAAIGKKWMPDFSSEKYYCDGCGQFHPHHIAKRTVDAKVYCARSWQAKQASAQRQDKDALQMTLY